MDRTRRRIRISIDAMGGDYAPGEIVRGAVEAAEQDADLEPILVGPLDTLEEELAKYDISGLPIRCVHADEFIGEGENPALAIRRRPNPSIVVATKLVKAKEADGLLAATATGALVTSAVQILGMLDGIKRPVLGAVLSLIAPTTVVLDLGVNMDCKPQHLLNFAAIGTVYAHALLGVSKPKVALLNIGKEKVKGNQLLRETYPLLEKSGLNFIGNIEGNEILSGKANVIVCDGFVGNHIFKFSESVGQFINNYIMNKFKDDPEVGRLLGNRLEELMDLLALPDVVGGGILWGVDGVVARTHGNSRAPMVTKRLLQAKVAIEKDVVGCLKTELSRIGRSVNL
jgi:glycerol-3-phosphate acyltransferase PlsX